MDPYLENPSLWSGFHVAFLVAMQDQLAPAVRPKYFVRVEERVYVASGEDPAFHLIIPDLRITTPRHSASASMTATVGSAVEEPIPVVEAIDAEIHEHRIEVIDRVDRSVVTVIELLSPANKMPESVGRTSFLRKRREVCASGAHWMEMDLLRKGTRTMNPAESANFPYQIYLSRAGQSRSGYVWPIQLRKKLPRIAVPLRIDDPQVSLDLQESMDHVYDRGGYDLDLDYSKEPVPPLDPGDAAWAREMLKVDK